MEKWRTNNIYKFKAGELVFEKVRPSQSLIVTRVAAHLYYCQVASNLHRKELVYFENELSLCAHLSGS